MRATPLAALAILAATPQALAQDNVPAGLFTGARQLPVVSQTLHVTARGGVAEIELTQVFLNDGPDLGQADYQLHLPEQATLTSFSFWRGQELVRAQLKEKGEAEAEHRKAAASGRATAILKTDQGVQRFSVFPVKSGEYQRVELGLQIPVVREMGRSQIALAMDRFLARGRATASVTVDVFADESLSELGVLGARAQVVSRSGKAAQLAFSTEQPAEVWWTEKAAAPLAVSAQGVPLPAGGEAIGVRILLDDAGAWRAPYSAVHVFVDGSFSMRRRRAALTQLLDRLLEHSTKEVRYWAVGEHLRVLDPKAGASAVAAKALEDTGFSTTADDFLAAMREARCDQASVRCVGVTDLSVPGLDKLVPLRERFVFLADAHERAFAGAALPSDMPVFQPDVEAPGKLRALADEKVLPVLDVEKVAQAGKVLEPIRPPSTRVAEGGLLRLFYEADAGSPVEVTVRIAGRAVAPMKVDVAQVEPESPAGTVLRHAFWERKLSQMMAAYAKSPDPDLKKLIVDASIREGVPTAFTALHGAAPELSLAAIKPGDPLLTVPAEPGLASVSAWYPFGEARELVRDPESGAFHDRFLVPRGWDDHAYFVEVFKRYDDGTTRQERTWYVLDDSGPQLSVGSADAEYLEVRQLDGVDDLSQVRIELDGGEVRTLSSVAGRWMLERAGLPESYTVVARDRAGNTTYLRVGGEQRPPKRMAGMLDPSAEMVPLRWEGAGGRIELAGEWVRANAGGRAWTFSHQEAPLRSTNMTAALAMGDSLVFGTIRGDLVWVDCRGRGCHATQLGGSFGEHAVTGLAQLGSGKVLVGILGGGLYELSAETLEKSRLDVGSAFITGVERHGSDVVVGTAYNGLWRIANGKAVRARFPSKVVTALRKSGKRVEIWSGVERQAQLGRDRFTAMAPSTLPRGSAATMSSAQWRGTLYVGLFDSGLARWNGERLEKIELPLMALERHVNALAVFGDALWMATEGGLVRATASEYGWIVERILPEPAQDMAASENGLAIATASGLAIIDSSGNVRRAGAQSGADMRRLFAVAWVGRTLYAGGMEGLYRFDGRRSERIGASRGFDGGWVTALAERDGKLYAGTYANGVYRVDSERASHIAGLERQWVPLRAMASVSGKLWVGGLGMPAASVDEALQVRRIHLPVRDTNGFARTPAGILFLTSDGPVAVEADALASAR